MDEIARFLAKYKDPRWAECSNDELASQLLDERIKALNELDGDLTGYDCPICRNKGRVYGKKDKEEIVTLCSCHNIRANMRRIQSSGLEKLINRYTFANYTCKEPWQKSIFDTAKEYIKTSPDTWFYIGGQVGAGKTHICTAIVSAFLNKSAKYMLWRDEVVPLKAVVNDSGEYFRIINQFKQCETLYIDDFFKTERGKLPTTADINIAFEIINYRYNNNLRTVISSEFTVDELVSIDGATGSRIYQRTKDYALTIGRDERKNMRLR